jgi:hypothetical protein
MATPSVLRREQQQGTQSSPAGWIVPERCGHWLERPLAIPATLPAKSDTRVGFEVRAEGLSTWARPRGLPQTPAALPARSRDLPESRCGKLTTTGLSPFFSVACCRSGGAERQPGTGRNLVNDGGKIDRGS